MPKVLLADDSVTIQKVVEIVLRESGFVVKAVNTGEDAIAALDAFSPDIVLADIQMPGISGYQLCEHLRKTAEFAELPVVLLAGAFEPLDQDLARKVGANGHLIKPFESKDLIDKINILLAARQERGQQPKAAPVAEAAAKPAHKTGAEELMEMDFSDIMAEPAAPKVEAAAPAPEPEPLMAAAAPPVEEVFDVVELADDEEAIEVAAVDVDAEDVVEVVDVVEAVEPVEPVETLAAPAMDTMPEISEEVCEVEPSIDMTPAPAAAVAAAPAMAMADASASIKAAVEAQLKSIDIAAIVSDAAESRIAAMVRPEDVSAAIRAAIAPSLNDAVEKILWEVMPDLIEKLLQDAIRQTVEPLRKEVESVVWETVPDLAETIIRQEIESIRSGN